MTTRPKNKSEDIVADGRQVLARYRQHRAAFEEADRNRKAKLLGPALISKIEKALVAAERAIGTQQVLAHVVATTTRQEEALRAEVFEQLSNIRAEVKLAYPNDRGIARAFGVGKKIAPRSTPGLLEAASAVIESFAESTFRTAASVMPGGPQT